VVFLVDQVRRYGARALGRRAPGSCVVLEYHAIPPSHRPRFARHLDLLRRIAVPVKADSHQPLTPFAWHAAITFDDGLTSFRENALPELEARGIPSTVFAVADRLGTVPSWTRFSPGAMPDEKMMNGEELRSLPPSVLIGSHGATHERLTELSDRDARREIGESRSHLEAILGRPVTLFSFPYGACDARLEQYCRDAGYERIFTNLPLLALSEPDEFVSGRVEVKPTDWLLEVRLKIAGSYRWLPYGFAVKRALRPRRVKRRIALDPQPQEMRTRLPR
jgi:peptidoglycan/xylan/chitin deacetylase (PgdA/CDA1 family)